MRESDDSFLAQATRGFGLRDVGASAEALIVWDRLLASAEQQDGDAEFVIAEVRYARAHLLLELDRPEEARAAAADAVAVAESIAGIEAEVIAAQASGLERAALTALGQLDTALEIDQRLSERYGDSDTAELRLCAARALQHEIWARMNQKEHAGAIACARRLIDILGSVDDPEQLVEIGELILSTAEDLDQHRVWRRHPPALRDQARAMREMVLDLANRAGGDLGAAVTLNARLALGNADARDRHLATAFKKGRGRPPIAESTLPALEQVQEAARRAGAKTRYWDLTLERAAALHDIGRTDEARQILDDLIARLDVDGEKGGAVLVRAMRRMIAS
jgi:hypothetical protein